MRIERGVWNPCCLFGPPYVVFHIHCILLLCRGACGSISNVLLFKQTFELSDGDSAKTNVKLTLQFSNYKICTIRCHCQHQQMVFGFRELSGCWVKSHVTSAIGGNYFLAFVRILPLQLPIQVWQTHALC